ncbi:MAG: S8 family serine peptidase [Armatimonadota bacterium]|nr:S8 family serine peptidase [Armatimonadota bacterium]
MRMRARMVAVWLGVLLAMAGVHAQQVAFPFRTGELIVVLKPTTSFAQLQQIAQQEGVAEIRDVGTPGIYHLILSGVREGKVDAEQTQATAERLRASGLLDYAAPNRIYRFLQVEVRPNDIRYGEQWGLEMINMPRAWSLQKGREGVVVAVLDSGVQTTHPDLQGRLLPGRDTADQDDDPNPPNVNDPFVSHGTHATGIIAAVTNNSLGVAGVTWEGVRVLPIKVALDSNISAPSADGLLRGMRLAIDRRVQVINLSVGGADDSDRPDPNDPFVRLVLEATQQGIVVVCGAGNSYQEGNPPITPANVASISDLVLAVAAVGPRRERAIYSSARPYTTVAAPGGNSLETGNPRDGILSTVVNSTYDYYDGTSFAAPHVSGAVALLLSQGVPAREVKRLLQETAMADGRNVPNNEFGYGIVDVYGALRRVATSALVVSPARGQVVETLKPVLEFSVTNTTPSLVTITINGERVPESEVAANYRADASGRTATIRIVRRLSPGSHTVRVTARNSTDPNITSTDELTFQIVPHVLRAGRSLVSFPYFQSQEGQPSRSVPAEQWMGSGFRLYRWLPREGRYAKYSPIFTPRDAEASFDGVTEAVGPEGGAPTPPVGLAYFIDVDIDTPVNTEGQPVPAVPYRIPLRAGWNMIGNPFAHSVPWVACEVETAAGTRLSLLEAVERGILLPHLYRYEGGRYSWQTAPAGILRAWEGFWVRAFADCTLIVQPLAVGTRSSSISVAAEGWQLRFSATAGKGATAMAIVGASRSASDRYGHEDVLKPPSLSPYVSVHVVNSEWAQHAGKYVQDMRSAASRRHVWQLEVETDQTEQPVTLSWQALSSLPKDIRLALVDQHTGHRLPVRPSGSYTYNPGGVATRSFLLIAEPSTLHALRISSVRVRPGRGGSYSIDYALSAEAQVRISLVDAAGRTRATLAQGTRAAGLHTAVWNGRDNAGVALPAGSYLLRIEAVNSDGEQTRTVTPVVITR